MSWKFFSFGPTWHAKLWFCQKLNVLYIYRYIYELLCEYVLFQIFSFNHYLFFQISKWLTNVKKLINMFHMFQLTFLFTKYTSWLRSLPVGKTVQLADWTSLWVGVTLMFSSLLQEDQNHLKMASAGRHHQSRPPDRLHKHRAATWWQWEILCNVLKRWVEGEKRGFFL